MKNVSKEYRFIYLLLFSLLTELRAHFDDCGSGPSVCSREVKIRSYDGSCNNLRNPRWGSAKGLYGRVLPAQYHDGKCVIIYNFTITFFILLFIFGK